jgi:hypothetical protein
LILGCFLNDKSFRNQTQPQRPTYVNFVEDIQKNNIKTDLIGIVREDPKLIRDGLAGVAPQTAEDQKVRSTRIKDSEFE